MILKLPMDVHEGLWEIANQKKQDNKSLIVDVLRAYVEKNRPVPTLKEWFVGKVKD